MTNVTPTSWETLAFEPLTQSGLPLTERETDALVAARSGGLIADIGGSCTCRRTVKNRLSSAIGEIAGRSRADAMRVARERGWL